MPVSLRKNIENAETPVQVADIPVHHSADPKSRHLLKSMDNLFNLEVYIPSRMFCDFSQRFSDILKLVLDPAHVLFVNGTKAVPLQRVVIVVGGFQLSFQRGFRTIILDSSIISIII
jgi:hypothetical protein